MDVEIIQKEKIMDVRVSGRYSPEAMNTMIKKVFAALARHAYLNCLIDFRQVTGSPDTLMERFEWARLAIRLQEALPEHMRQIRIATVGSEPFMDSERLVETLIVNWGMNVMVTDDLDEALRWLEVDGVEVA